LEDELDKTLLELSSVQEIIKLLQEEGSVKWTGCESTRGRKSHLVDIPIQSVRKVVNWIPVTTGRHKRPRKPEMNHMHLIPTSVNRYELLNNLHEPPNSAQNPEQVMENTTENRIKGALVRKQHKVIIIGGHVRGCAAEYCTTLGRLSKSQVL
jgi:hypothetical protein